MNKKSNFIIFVLLFIAIVILILSFFFFDDNISDYAKDINFTDDKQLLAIAYLEDISEVNSEYLFENVKVFEFLGNEYYFVIPRYKDMKINIYEAVLNEEKLEKGDLIGVFDTAFVINCDENDDMSSVIIEIEYDEILFQYSPSFDFKNNKVNINEYMLDITG